MADQMKLSQAEIDALLNGNIVPSQDEPVLSDEHKDMLGEIGNISFGSAATSLSALLQQRVEITTPHVSLLRADDPPADMTRPYVLVSVEFTDGLRGTNALAIHIDDAKTIADLMLGGDGTNTSGELNELHLSAVGEAMNQMMGGAATSMAAIFNRPINISPPKVRVVDLSSGPGDDLPNHGWIVNVSFRLRVGSLIDSNIMQLIPLDFAREIIGLLRGISETAVTAEATVPQANRNPSAALGSLSGNTAALETAVSQMSASTADTSVLSHSVNSIASGAGQNVHDTSHPASASLSESAPVVKRADFMDFSGGVSMQPTPRNLSLLFDVPLTVTVELGRTKRAIRDILDLSPGAILELDKLAGEPVDILVNNKRIAVGEVVVIDENFGVRVTDILSPVERVKNLQ
jgi:flagellar motor switch protein FliN/FliY